MFRGHLSLFEACCADQVINRRHKLLASGLFGDGSSHATSIPGKGVPIPNKNSEDVLKVLESNVNSIVDCVGIFAL